MNLRVIEARPATKKKKQVCAYARVSTDSDKQELSLENQIISYRQMIENNPDYEFVGVYVDQGISGFSEKRPDFQRMMQDARAGKIDLIIDLHFHITAWTRIIITGYSVIVQNAVTIFKLTASFSAVSNLHKRRLCQIVKERTWANPYPPVLLRLLLMLLTR